MTKNAKTEDIQVLQSTNIGIPLLRAGYANIYFPTVICLLFIGKIFSEDMPFAFLLWIVVALLVLKLTFNYFNTAAKIIFKHDEIILIKPVHKETIQVEDIISTKLVYQKLNSYIKVKIKTRGSLLHKSFIIVIMRSTSFGDFAETIYKLKKILKRYEIKET